MSGTKGHFMCRPCNNARVLAYYKTPRGKFRNQKNGARVRGIPWRLTFEQWWALWAPHWDKRGHGAGKLQMCRHNDSGAYEVGNVYIATHEQNVSDAWKNGCHEIGRAHV